MLTPTRSRVIETAPKRTFWNEVGTTATESHRHLKPVAPWPLESSTRPRRQWTRSSDDFAVTNPQRLVLAGSSTGRPARQPSISRSYFAIAVTAMHAPLLVDADPDHIGPGRTVGLVGASGVGKPSLVNLLVGQEALATAPSTAMDAAGT